MISSHQSGESDSLENRVLQLLSEFHNFTPGAREQAIATLQGLERSDVIGVLQQLLYHPDPDVKCDSAEALLRVDAKNTVDLLIPLLNDSNYIVRWCICGFMHDCGNANVVPALVRLLQHDPNAKVRGAAASALGAIGDTTVLPLLQQATELDTGVDNLGYSVQDLAARAIQEIQARE